MRPHKTLGTAADPSKVLDWGGGHIWDLRGIFLAVESAQSAARFRPHCNLVNPLNPVVGCRRVENSSEQNSPWAYNGASTRIAPKSILILGGSRSDAWNASRQDIGDGGKLWDAIREQDHVAGGKKAACTFLHTKGDNITANFRK